MHVMTRGFCGDKPVTNQAWHTRIVVQLMNSAKGDLMLDCFGNLTTRVTLDSVTFKDLPYDRQSSGETLAMIGRDGWLLTATGAQWIIENCPPYNASDMRRLRATALVYT